MNSEIFKLLLFAVMIAFTSCSTGPEFERENENDPKSQEFTPDLNALEVKLNNDKTVSLRWVDNSGFEDGIIVAKTLGKQGIIEILDMLSANSVSYTDDSKLLDAITTYHVGGFKNGSNFPDSAKFISRKLDFGQIKDFEYSSKGNEVTLSWISDIPHVDTYIIKKSGSGISDSIIDTLSGNLSEVTFTTDDEVYFLDITVSAQIVNHQGQLVEVYQKTLDEVEINFPILKDVSVVNEAIVNITFDDHSVFNDKFIVYERTKSAWHQPSSEYVPLDTLSESGPVFITKTSNSEREFAIEGIYQNERSGLSESVEIEYYSYPPYMSEHSFISVSPTSVKLTWQDHNEIEPTYAATYQFELSLFNSETGELLRQIILPPNTTQYTLEDLSPSINYEFTLKTYNSYTPDPIAFSFHSALKKDSDYTFSAEVGSATRILADQERIVYSEYEYGTSGLKVFDINTKSTQTIYDTGENPADYENKVIEDFTFTENLDLIATIRQSADDFGEEIVAIHVNNRRSGSSEYFEKQIQRNSYEEEIHLVGFTSDSTLIYIWNNEYTDDGLKVYKWNFFTDESEVIFERVHTYYTASLIDDNKIVLGAYENLLLLSKNGAVIQEFKDPNYGSINTITPSSISDSYTLNIGGVLYRYTISDNTIERLGSIDRVDAFFEVPDYNYLICRTGGLIQIFNLETGSLIYPINDYEQEMRFQSGAYIPNRDQIIFQYGGYLLFFNLEGNWVTTNFNCC